MQRIIRETEEIAYRYLGEFGFSKDEISPLVSTGKKDLEANLIKLKALINSGQICTDEINNTLHALKGLFFHLGNTEVAKELNEIRSDLDNKASIEKIKHLLFSDI